MTARDIIVVTPPQRCLRTRFEDVGDVAGLGETNIELAQRTADDHVRAVPNPSAVFVLIEAQQDESLHEPTGLRDAEPDRRFDLTADWISLAGTGVVEKGDHVPHRRHPDPEHQWILRGKDELVDQVRIKAMPQADLRRTGHSR